jgi:cold shock CspA family protein
MLRFGAQGYGWASIDGSRKTAFVHINDVRERLAPREGDRIEFEILETPKGPKALDVELLIGVRQ